MYKRVFLEKIDDERLKEIKYDIDGFVRGTRYWSIGLMILNGAFQPFINKMPKFLIYLNSIISDFWTLFFILIGPLLIISIFIILFYNFVYVKYIKKIRCPFYRKRCYAFHSGVQVTFPIFLFTLYFPITPTDWVIFIIVVILLIPLIWEGNGSFMRMAYLRDSINQKVFINAVTSEYAMVFAGLFPMVGVVFDINPLIFLLLGYLKYPMRYFVFYKRWYKDFYDNFEKFSETFIKFIILPISISIEIFLLINFIILFITNPSLF